MKLKSLVLVVVVLAALSGVAFWLNRPPPPPPSDPRVGQPLVETGLIDKAARLRLTDQGKTVELSRGANGSWQDDSYFGLPADFSKLSSFINDLTGAKVDRLVTSNPDRIGRLEFTGTRLALLDAAGKDMWAVNLGKNAEQGGRFVRFGDENKAYLASLNAWLDTDPKGWANATLLDLKADDIASIEVPLDDAAATTLSRAKKDDPWKAAPLPTGKQLRSDKVAGILSSLGSLRFSDSSDPKEAAIGAARHHLKTYRLTTFAGKTYTVELGRKPEEKKLKPLAQSPKVDLSFKPGQKPAADAKPPAPEYETIPAGPVYVWVSPLPSPSFGSRAFQVDEYTYTSLPQKAEDLFEPPAKK